MPAVTPPVRLFSTQPATPRPLSVRPESDKEKGEIKIMRLYSAEASRRDLLRSVACAPAGVAFAKGKRSKADVEYQDTPHGIERCEICAPFLPPDQCRTVVGPVSRQGWCKIYEGA